jgi:hypothetical protein
MLQGDTEIPEVLANMKAGMTIEVRVMLPTP